MKEIQSIIKAFDTAQFDERNSALVTVVHLEGSSYRRPGARMLVSDDGAMTGAISGGCLEGDALRKALLVLNQQQKRLVTYDTNDEDDASIGVQLGCAGVIQVLIEPINKDDPNNSVELLRKAVAKRQASVLVTVFSLQNRKGYQHGTCLLVEEDGTISGNLKDDTLREMLLDDVKLSFREQRSSFKNYTSDQNEITAFIEYINPAVSLILIGAGNDVIPLVSMADIMGWETTVIDGRPSHAKKERFSSTCQVIISKPENVLEQISIDQQTVFVLMTHNYNYDFAMLKALVKTKAKYIGMLGPRKKFDRMQDDMKSEGIKLSDVELSRIYSPVGLELGAETAEEIALSIISEIKAVLAGKMGGSLRHNMNPIHSTNNLVISDKNIS
ncbi:XdhC family protein [Flavihumibacter sp.]|uniref:XdhC family protein n=1 Tax=Flavihumibacter sp. TaxID=1913981 RepID=UPI002FCC148C|nr:XdhC family protein [Flavihumibacter sediminis]